MSMCVHVCMYVAACACVSMYACEWLCMRACVSMHVCGVWLPVHVCEHACVWVAVHVWAYVCMYVVHSCLYIRV